MKSRRSTARCRNAAVFAVESLEKRVLLSAPVLVHNAPYTALTPGATTIPWKQDYPAAVVSGHEQLISVVKGNGVTEILATPQNFANQNSIYGETEFGPTDLRLYSEADGSSTWYETDINNAFDGQADKQLIGTHEVHFARKDDQMAMDGQGNLYIEYSSDLSALAVDRIPAWMVNDLANNISFTPFSSATVLDPAQDVAATNSGNYRPQLAVGSLFSDPTKTAVYIYGGDPNSGENYATMFVWEGTSTDPFHIFQNGVHNPLWNAIADGDVINNVPIIGAYFNPMTVGGNGDLYSFGYKGSEIYQLDGSAGAAAAFTPVFATAYGSSPQGLVAYTSPTDGGTTLYSLSRDANLFNTVATTSVSGPGAGTWTSPATPIIPSIVGASGALLAVDPRTGQASVLYQNASHDTLSVAVDTGGLWSRRVIASSISFAAPNPTGTYGNDVTHQQWYSVFNGAASVAWMQNDSSVTGTPSDVAEMPVDIGPATGDVLEVANDPGGASNAITLSGSALAGGTMTVVVDGTTYTENLTNDLVRTIVTDSDSATLTIDETAGSDPMPLWGVDFTNSGGGQGALRIIGAGSTPVGDSYLTLPNGAVYFPHATPIELDLNDGNDLVEFNSPQAAALVVAGSGNDSVAFNTPLAGAATVVAGSGNDLVTAAFDMSAATSALTFTGGAGTDRLVLNNTGASSAQATATYHHLSLGNFGVAYDANLSSIEVDGSNSMSQAIDVSAVQPIVPRGSALAPGFSDASASIPVSSSSPSNSALMPNPTVGYWIVDGFYLGVHLSNLNFSAGGNANVMIGSTPSDQLYERYLGNGAADLSIELGSGVNQVTLNAALRTTRNTRHLNVLSGGGNDTVTVDGVSGVAPAEGEGTPPPAGITSLTFTGGTGTDTLNLDFSGFSGGDYLNLGLARFVGDPNGNNTVRLIGGGDAVSAAVASGIMSFSTNGDRVQIPGVQTIRFNGGNAGADAINIASGSYTVDANTPTGTPNVSVTVGAAGIATFASDQHIANLTINDGTAYIATPARRTMYLGGLGITGIGLLDIGNGFIYLPSTPANFTAFQQYWVKGYNINSQSSQAQGIVGDWTGRGGITSSIARASYASSGNLKITLGVYDGAFGAANGVAMGPGADENTGASPNLTSSQILIRPTLAGDMNGAGTVNDYDILIFNNFGFYLNGTTNLGTQVGDLNGDGVVNDNDILIFNTAGNYLNGSYL